MADLIAPGHAIRLRLAPRPRSVLGAAVLLLATSACGGAKSSAADAGAGEDYCPSPGVAWTGCRCSADQPAGLRQCGTNHDWSACACPPGGPPKCIEGQTVVCDVCPGETEGRKTTCLRDSTFDCACRDRTGGTGTGGKPAPDGDAG